LRADDHDRLVRLDRQVEKERRFFQPVGTVGDDDTGKVGPLQELVDAPGQPDPLRWHDFSAGDVGELLGFDLGEPAQLRHALHDLVDRPGPGPIPA
jgi:hypothetical protein